MKSTLFRRTRIVILSFDDVRSNAVLYLSIILNCTGSVRENGADSRFTRERNAIDGDSD